MSVMGISLPIDRELEPARTRIMKKTNWIQAAVATTAIGFLLSTAWPGPVGVAVGDEVSYDFRSALVNSRGADSLSDFKGKPVLVEFWGTR